MTFEALEPVAGFTLVLGGSGCGLSMTLDPGDRTKPDFEFLPETMMIDLSPPDCLAPSVADSASTIFEPDRLIDRSKDGCWPWPSAAKAKLVARITNGDKTYANEKDFIVTFQQ